MTTITIDDIAYDLDTLSADAKAQLMSIQFVDQELARLRALGHPQSSCPFEHLCR